MQMIVNVTGAALATVLIGYMFIHYRYLDVEPTGCMEAYGNALRFNLAKADGSLLSAIELQARAGHEERGLMQNASVVALSDAPVTSGLEVQAGRDQSSTSSIIGINFPWRPRALNGAQSACIRYSVYLPQDFDYGAGGILPGFFGGALPARLELVGDQSFVARAMWTKEGDAAVWLQGKPLNEHATRVLSNPASPIKLEPGRWITIEHELVLNSPGNADGQVHAWIDGVKVLDEKGVNLRQDASTGIDGVAATVGYAVLDNGKTPAAEKAKLRITAMDIGWR